MMEKEKVFFNFQRREKGIKFTFASLLKKMMNCRSLVGFFG